MSQSWIICQGAQINCTSPNSGLEGDPSLAGDIDPDVAGYGVIAAFIATAAMTLVAIYFGYITDCLDNAQLNHIDAKAVHVFRRLLSLKPLPQDELASVKEEKKVRSEALVRFILTFSDQQLVTGLAVLIASFAKRCTITGTNFQIATSLAWFSSVTHLATLSVLRLNFMQRPRVRLLRLLGMVAVLGLLLIAELIPAFLNWELALPLQCALNSGTGSGYFSSITVSSLVSNPFVGTALILYLIIAYGNKIISLYHKDSQVTAFGWLLQRSYKRFPSIPAPSTYQQRAKQKLIATHWVTKRSILDKLRYWFSMVYFFLNELLNSFLWELSFATFGFSYGLIQVLTNRWPQYFYNFSQPFDTGDVMGFGQIVPLLLLFLPGLAAVEVYEDVQVLLKKSPAPSISATSHSQSHQQVQSDPPVPASTIVDHEELLTAASPADVSESTSVPTGIVVTEAEPGANSARSSILPQSHNGEVRTVQANATDEDSGFIHTGLDRNRGTERSIGMELHHVQSSADRQSVANHLDQTLDESLTPKQLDEIYNLPDANRIISVLVLLSYAFFALFATALTGFLPLDPFTPTILIFLWGVWYFWGFIYLFWRGSKNSFRRMRYCGLKPL